MPVLWQAEELRGELKVRASRIAELELQLQECSNLQKELAQLVELREDNQQMEEDIFK